MPRNDDDDRPRRPRDDDDDRPTRSRRPYDDDDEEPPPKKKGNGLLIGILVGVFVVCCGGGGTAVYFIFVAAKRGVEQFKNVVEDAAETQQSQQNLTQIGRAAHAYHDKNNAFPNNSYETGAKQSRPLLSWRVHLLPFLGENALYQQFKLDQPWDSPNNIRLLNQMPAIYGSPEAQKKAGAGKTYYRGFTSPGGIFEKPMPGNPTPKIRLTDIPDGTTNTILVVDAGTAVEWTKPDDLDFSPGQPRPSLGGAYPNLPSTLVLMCDGTVHHMRKDIADETLRNLIDRKDGNIIPLGWDQ